MLKVLKGQLSKPMQACCDVYSMKSLRTMFNARRATCAMQVRRIQIYFDPQQGRIQLHLQRLQSSKVNIAIHFLVCSVLVTHDMTRHDPDHAGNAASHRCDPVFSDGLLCSNASTTPVIDLMKRHLNETR